MSDAAHLDPRELNRTARRAAGPNEPTRAFAVTGINLVAAALMFTGWWEASGSASAHDQVQWLGVSVCALILSGVANGVWLAGSRRTVVLARSMLLPLPRERAAAERGQGAMARPRPASIATRASGSAGAGTVAHTSNGKKATAQYAAVGTTIRYHRVDCALVAGKEVWLGTRDDHESTGRRACEVCRP